MLNILYLILTPLYVATPTVQRDLPQTSNHKLNVLLDVDECSIGVDDCPDESICSNTEGGFNCTCKLGYRFKDEERQECIGILAKG